MNMHIPARNSSINKRGIRSPTKRIRMRKSARFDEPAFSLHKYKEFLVKQRETFSERSKWTKKVMTSHSSYETPFYFFCSYDNNNN